MALTVCTVLLIGFFYHPKVHSNITVEAGSSLNIYQFIINKDDIGKFVTDLSTIDMSQPGTHKIEIEIDGKLYTSNLIIEDTVPPRGEVLEVRGWKDEEVPAEDFVTNITDVTDVMIYYKEKPDFSFIGEQVVIIILEDTSGNKTELNSKLTIIEDTEPPVIHGAFDQTVHIGETISYRRFISIEDNRDEEVELIIDNSEVNLRRAGEYKVTYTAIDSSGNSTSVTVTITVKDRPANSVEESELNEKVDKILSDIITQDMSEIEMAWNIYLWTRNHITNVGYSDKSFWMNEAMRGIQRGTGDCFTFYATARALLTRVGIENIPIERDSKTSSHYWNLVKINNQWYHFDANPNIRQFHYVTFLRTDEEVLEYTRMRNDNYFTFDKSKYPRTPVEPLVFDRTLP